MRKTGMKAAIVAGIFSCLTASAFASGGVDVTADEALQKLIDGNKRYVAGQMTCGNNSDAKVRESLINGQKPYAVILSCSDSRVPPEIIFDKGLGEIFVIRVAGNVPDPIVLGSIEYAAEHIGTHLIMVLGHEKCGAVTAAVTAKGKPEGNIGAIVRSIAPAVKKAHLEAKGKSQDELVETAVNDNVKLVAKNMLRRSMVLNELAKEGKIRIVTAKYDLDDGTVTLLK